MPTMAYGGLQRLTEADRYWLMAHSPSGTVAENGRREGDAIILLCKMHKWVS